MFFAKVVASNVDALNKRNEQISGTLLVFSAVRQFGQKSV
jgi:hypothetical protein|tara:strand:- start:31 stop:150 length:120 start_codon:yes stop_codon:yes gene_type:complete